MGGRIGEGMPRMANERLPERSIPDRSPGHAFIAIAHAGWWPAHQGMKSRSCGLVQRTGTVDSATPQPDPSGGQAPALHFPRGPCDYRSLPLPRIGQTTSTLPSRTPNISSWSITVVSL